MTLGMMPEPGTPVEPRRGRHVGRWLVLAIALVVSIGALVARYRVDGEAGTPPRDSLRTLVLDTSARAPDGVRVRVRIINTTSSRGLAKRATSVLRDFGYDVDLSKPTSKHAPKPENRIRTLDPYAIAAIRLLLLTGARLREILHLRWEYVDLERGIVHVPDSKTGRKPIYLSSAAMAILKKIPRQQRNPYVIVGDKQGSPRSDLKKPWAAIVREAGLPGLRLHDLRHSFDSIGAGASLGLPIIGRLLGHSTPSTTQRYAHLDADPMHRAADTIGALISAALTSTTSAEASEPS